MPIRVATADKDISACFPVMRELRPHLAESEFVDRVRRQEVTGYRLALIQVDQSVVAVAGFRLAENLAWGRFLYVDDLVTLPDHRSHGYGAQLLDWLRKHAAGQGCAELHLDSGTQRTEAHRFYEREGMSATSLHFAEKISPRST